MPSPNTLTEQAARNAERYWYEDGYVNVFIGIFILSLALISYFSGPSLRRHENRLPLMIGWFLYALVPVLSRPIIKWLKEHLTYPRTGYAAPPDRPIPDTGFFAPPMPTQMELEYRLRQEATVRWYWAFAVLLLVSFYWPSRWFCVPTGVLFGGIWHRLQPATRLQWIVPCACAVVGLAASFIPIQDNHCMAVVIIFFGAIHIFDGLYKLLVYLRRNPVASVPEP